MLDVLPVLGLELDLEIADYVVLGLNDAPVYEKQISKSSGTARLWPLGSA